MAFTILIVDDEYEVCLSLSEVLTSKGYNTLFQENPLKVMDVLKKNKIDLIIMDIKMPQMNGIDLLKIIKKELIHIPIIIISGYATVDNAVKAMKYGAINLYTKPIELPELLSEIEQLSINIQNKQNNIYDSKIITHNKEMHKILDLMKKAAPTDAPVLITGESGTGKELIASSLHNLSQRKNKPYITINCAAIPDSLLESELFGHEKGSFTDAKSQRKGKFEIAASGSIFLDEIGDMSLKTQAKMLRVLQEKQFSRIGGSELIKANSRVIAATNKNLTEMIKQGSFREDLYFRCSVITLHLPPLRERKEDIISLTEYFLSHFNRVYSKNIKSISNDVQTILLEHKWTGNIRELKNFIERAVIFSDTNIIDMKNIPSQYKTIITNKNENLDEKFKEISKNMILEALAKTNGIKKKAASLLNINRKTLYNRMKKLEIK